MELHEEIVANDIATPRQIDAALDRYADAFAKGKAKKMTHYECTARKTRSGKIIRFPPPANLDGLSHTELKNLVVTLFEQLAEQQRIIAALRDEIARLEGGPRRPNLKRHAFLSY